MISVHMAPAKANTAALGRRDSKFYEDVINNGRMAILSAPAISAMVQGGMPIEADGDVVGAVGVSGVQSHQDEQVARAGIAALAL